MTQNFDWRPFLERWSADWVAAESLEDPEERDEDTFQAGWLGFAPADEERITALERRLARERQGEVRLPPSYRSFLAVTDGWRYAGGSVYLLGTTEAVHWHGDPMGMREVYAADLDGNSSPDEVLRAQMWGRALQLSLDSDMTDVLLDPGDVNADGEWAVYVYKGWSGEYPEKYASFADFMRTMFRSLHYQRGDDPAFVSQTTREADAAVERARLDCLAGAVDGPRETLREAAEYGRPRAQALISQLEAMLGHGARYVRYRSLDDPVYANEMLPLLTAEHVRVHRDDDWLLRPHGDEDREQVAALLTEIVEHTFRYTAPGPFGKAVAAAREQARWGQTEDAWHTIAAAVGGWQPYDDKHLAPIGLLADPLLGPLITPERGRQILATARAGQLARAPRETTPSGAGPSSAPASSGPGTTAPPSPGWPALTPIVAPAPRGMDGPMGDATVADSTTPDITMAHGPVGDATVADGPVGDTTVADGPTGDTTVADGPVGGPPPDGLAWLAEPDESSRGYGFLLARGLTPPELVERLGLGPLLAPHRQDELTLRRWSRRPGPGEGWRSALRIGSCGTGWSFGFESDIDPFPRSELSDLGERAAIDGGASITVWSSMPREPSDAYPCTFHFGYAEDGQHRFGFTVRGQTVERTGQLPESLEPGRFFPGQDPQPGATAVDGTDDTSRPATDDSGRARNNEPAKARPWSDDGSAGEAGPGCAGDAQPGTPRGGDGQRTAAERARAAHRAAERRALAAIADSFGASLPRFAIRHGRLHAVPSEPRTRSASSRRGRGEEGRGDGVELRITSH